MFLIMNLPILQSPKSSGLISCDHNITNTPSLRFVNATDDPMIAPDVIDVPIRIARTKDKVVHVQTQVRAFVRSPDLENLKFPELI